MTNKTSTDVIAVTCLSFIVGIAFALFVYPWLCMTGWNAVAWNFNLPTFNYWQMFAITHSVRWILSALVPSSDAAQKRVLDIQKKMNDM